MTYTNKGHIRNYDSASLALLRAECIARATHADKLMLQRIDEEISARAQYEKIGSGLNKRVARLWDELTAAIDVSKEENASFLREHEYRKLIEIKEREAAAERQHRRWREGPYKLTITQAAFVVMLSQIARGASRPAFDPTVFFAWRESAALASLAGFTLRHDLTPEWIADAAALDYAELMKVSA